MATNEVSANNDQSLRDHLLPFYAAAMRISVFDDFIAGFPAESCGRGLRVCLTPPGKYSSTMRIAQWDILEILPRREPRLAEMAEGIGQSRTNSATQNS